MEYIPPGSRTWLSIFTDILYARCDSAKESSKWAFSQIKTAIEVELQDRLSFPPWLIDTFKYVLAHRLSVISTHTHDNDIMQDIKVLRASFASLGHDNERCQIILTLYLMASNRYLRKLCRLYKRLHPDDDLFVQLIELFTRQTVSHILVCLAYVLIIVAPPFFLPPGKRIRGLCKSLDQACCQRRTRFSCLGR